RKAGLACRLKARVGTIRPSVPFAGKRVLRGLRASSRCGDCLGSSCRRRDHQKQQGARYFDHNAEDYIGFSTACDDLLLPGAGKRQTNIVGSEILDPVKSARIAGLRYVTDRIPGIRRIRAGKGFRYLQPNGKVLKDPAELRRIRSLAIPPAWTRVWICPLEDAHLQAVGRDAKGRKQYRYHPQWRAVRDSTKFH